MNIHKRLQSIGLTQSETDIYLFLLQNSLSSPPVIAKGTGIARTNCYHILQSLKEKQLISEQSISKGKRKAYVACDPQALIESMNRKTAAAQELLPDLRALYTVQKNKPLIRFFDGFEEVKQIYDQSLTAKKIMGIGSTKRLQELDPQFYTHYLKQVQKKGIVFYDILSHPSGEHAGPHMKQIVKGLYDMKLIPKQYGDFATDILIWEDTIALLTLEEPIFGTTLTNPLLANTFLLLFKVFWEQLSNFDN
ncbi:MAG: hypothetical protein HYV32_02730 [Candidatus Kerfeldbacteria bacterium]|nr:hypothetical protein [Candidatus Kerfeldbacteria bacterium]